MTEISSKMPLSSPQDAPLKTSEVSTPLWPPLRRCILGGALSIGLAAWVTGLVEAGFAASRAGLDPLQASEVWATLGLAGFLNGGLGLALGFALGGVVGLLPERWRSQAKPFLFSRKGVALALTLFALAGAALLFKHLQKPIEWHALNWRLGVSLLAGGASFGAALWAMKKPKLLKGLAISGLVLLTLSAGLWGKSGEAGDEALLRLGTETALSSRLVLWARSPFDQDKDGFPTLLCRSDCDCDDSQAKIRPGAVDIAGNGIDEDCSGKDLSNAEVARFDALLEKSEAAEPAPTPKDPKVEEEQASPEPKVDPGPPNILFITVDALRADHLGFDGYPKPTSPNLDAIAAQGTVFSQTRATGPQTRFSVPPMMVGKYFTELKRTGGDWPRIDEEETTFVEQLSAAGYHTAAFQSIGYLAPLYGMAQGFDHYDTSCFKARSPLQNTETSDYITDQVLAHVDEESFQNRGGPFLLWTYYGDPHSDYIWHEGIERLGPTRKDKYDNEIAFVDLHIGRLLDGLRERGLLENTVIILTSDHGEGLVESEDHGHLFHGPTLYDEVMRVPFFFWGPGIEAQDVETPVSLIDLPPTVLDLARLAPSPSHRGVSLVPFLKGQSPGHPPLFFEKEKETALPQKGAVIWPYKVILVMPYNRVKIYNLVEDPKELDNLAKKLPEEQREELVGLLKYWSSQVLESRDPEVDD